MEALIQYWPVTSFVVLLIGAREAWIIKTLWEMRVSLAEVKAELGILKSGYEHNRIQRRQSLRRALVNGEPLPDHGKL